MYTITTELDTACVELARALGNADAVRRYEARLAVNNAAKWDNHFDYDLFINRATKLYGDKVSVIVGGRR